MKDYIELLKKLLFHRITIAVAAFIGGDFADLLDFLKGLF